MERVEVAERGCDLHLRRDVAVLQPVDLVQRDHDRTPSENTRRADWEQQVERLKQK